VIEDLPKGGFQLLRPYKFVSWIEQWVTCNRLKSGELVARSLSVSDAFKVLNAPQFTSALPPVDRFNPIRLPVLQGETLTLLPSGYHAPSRTFTARNSTRYELGWTKEKSVEFINNLLREFPFATPSAKAGVVAAMATVFCLGMLSPTCAVPAFVYTANDAGCGKGLCAMLATVPVFGFLPTGIHPSTGRNLRRFFSLRPKQASKSYLSTTWTGRLPVHRWSPF